MTTHTFIGDTKCAVEGCDWHIPLRRVGEPRRCMDHGGPSGPEYRSDVWGETEHRKVTWRTSERDLVKHG